MYETLNPSSVNCSLSFLLNSFSTLFTFSDILAFSHDKLSENMLGQASVWYSLETDCIILSQLFCILLPRVWSRYLPMHQHLLLLE